MLMFTLGISCLTTSNSSRLMDLTFQVPMQYCSLQHQTLQPHTSIAECSSHVGPATSFFLELLVIALCSSRVAYKTLPTWGAHFPVSYLFAFLTGTHVHGVSRQEYWSGLPVPPPVDHILSELFAVARHLWWPCVAWLVASPSCKAPSPQ